MKMLITIPQPERNRQVTFEDILNNTPINDLRNYDCFGTLTRYMEVGKFADEFNVIWNIERLEEFRNRFDFLYKVPRESLYTHSQIPKRKLSIKETIRGFEATSNKTGELLAVGNSRFDVYRKLNRNGYGDYLRNIDAPVPDLAAALITLKTLMESMMIKTYHTAAFAYVKNRCTTDAVKKHQKNESNWFGKFDFSDFFGSTTKEFVLKMLKLQFPWGLMMETERGTKAISDAIELCFLNGGLPQGTQMSPFLTNVMMIPFDHYVFNKLLKFPNKTSKTGFEKIIYTRYSDDINVSSVVQFNIKEVESFLNKTLADFGAPFKIKEEKTHYGNRAGSNYMLGVCLNKDNKISIGWEKKRILKASLNNYIMDSIHGNHWDLKDVQKLSGEFSYFKMIEKETVEDIISKFNKKYNVDVYEMIKKDLGGGEEC